MKNIDHVTINISDNNLWGVYYLRTLRHAGKAFPYFNFDNNEFLSDRIKLVSNTKHKENTVYLKKIVAKEKAKTISS